MRRELTWLLPILVACAPSAPDSRAPTPGSSVPQHGPSSTSSERTPTLEVLAPSTEPSVEIPLPSASVAAIEEPPAVPTASPSAAAHPPKTLAALDGCDEVEHRKVGVRAGAPLHRTFLFEGRALAVCIDSANYPYTSGRGHELNTRFVLRVGKDEQSYHGEGPTMVRFHGYEVRIGMLKPSHSSQSEVWLEVDRAGADTPL